MPPLKAAINWEEIKKRKCELNQRVNSSPYSKQKSSLENELSAFLRKSTPPKDITTATPDDVINFLIWKDSFGKTIVHKDDCPNFGDKKKSSCSCPRRLAFSTVDSMIGKLRSIFAQMGRTLDDASLPGYGNPAASMKVKKYLTSMREEQLGARSPPSQAQPFFLEDLAVLSEQIVKRLKQKSNTPTLFFIYTRDQAFFKIQFFAGDRAGDLGRTKTMEVLFSPNKDTLLFNHMLTKSLRDGTTNMFALKRNRNPTLCPVVALEVYVRMCDYFKIPIRQGYLFRPTSPSGEVVAAPFDSSAAQSRLSAYVKELPEFFKDRHITLHGLRSGCAISLALSGVEMGDIMSHVGWKTDATAQHYVKLRQVMDTNGACDILSRLPESHGKDYQARNELLGFTQAFQ